MNFDLFTRPVYDRKEASLVDERVSLNIKHKRRGREGDKGQEEKWENGTDRSWASTPTAPKRCKTRIPELTRPNIVCLLSKYGVGASVRKNCEPGGKKKRACAVIEGGPRCRGDATNEPLVLGPELAIARIPAPVNLNSGWISSSLGQKG